MHKIKIALTLLVLQFIWAQSINAKVWKVGSSHAYTKPSQVSTLVQNGDTVDIDAGVYPEDVARWSANNLLLRGVGDGYAHLKSNGASYGGKAIWVIAGNNVTVEWIEFSECTVPDKNGAGIRYEGLNLTVRHCYFHENEMGILGGEYHPSTVKIEYCEFAHQGYGDGYSHNVYIGNIDTLIFQGNYSHHAKIGHELKSRAYVNIILYNQLSNEATGTASREIDLPNGGTAIIMGNIIQQGPKSENSNIIGYGLEGLKNAAPHQVYLINNTIVNEKNNGSFVDLKEGTALFKCYNNIFAGAGLFYHGTAATIDTAGNQFYPGTDSVGFYEIQSYEYYIYPNAPAENAGVPAGTTTGGFVLTPEYEYRRPLSIVKRLNHNNIDAGAHEVNIELKLNQIKKSGTISSSIIGSRLYIITTAIITQVDIYDLNGRHILHSDHFPMSEGIAVNRLLPGLYFLVAKTSSGHLISTKVLR
jgi:hypothetical protein